MTYPKCIVIFSGKRKSGKDFVAERIQEKLGTSVCQILRLSGPLKQQYAQENGLDFEQLLNSSGYKEIHRGRMVKWGEQKRLSDPYFFCDKMVETSDSDKPVWVISDARRKTDVAFFREHFPEVSKCVRLSADLDVRRSRGFIFTPGIDDAESECGLDDGVEWDMEIVNNGNDSELEKSLEEIIDLVTQLIQR